MSALDEGGVWCGTCHRSTLHVAEAGGCACPPIPRPTPGPGATERDGALEPEEATAAAVAERYRKTGPYYVLGRIDSGLARARRDGDAALATTLHLAELAITDLIQRAEHGGGPS